MDLAPVASGNTIPSSTLKKAKNWMFTIFDIKHYDDIKSYITGLQSFNYLIAGREKAPTTDKQHIHMFCQFNISVKPSAKKCFDQHMEHMKSTPKDCREYCIKDNDILDEIGTMREWGGLPSITQAKNASDEQLETLPIQYYNIVKHIEDHKKKARFYKPVEFIWIYGTTGKGKTRMAFEAGAENVIYNNGFWSDWGEARIICIEEMRGQIPWDELLRLTDSYHNYYHVNIKGGQKYIDLDKIFITSPFPPERCYPNKTNDDSIKQLLRRISSIICVDAPKSSEEQARDTLPEW